MKLKICEHKNHVLHLSSNKPKEKEKHTVTSLGFDALGSLLINSLGSFISDVHHLHRGRSMDQK